MGVNDLVPTHEAVRLLRDAAVQDDYQRIYFDLLADRLEAGGGEIVPEGVLMVLVLLEHDLARGTSGFTGAAMPYRLSGLPPVMFTMLTRLAIQRIDEFFHPGFAAKVKEAWEQVMADVQKPVGPHGGT